MEEVKKENNEEASTEENKKIEIEDAVEIEKTKNVSKMNFKNFMVRLWKYLIKTSNGMAYGLFATLIIGTIIGTIGSFIPTSWSIGSWNINEKIGLLATTIKSLMGIGIGFGVALTLKLTPLQMLSAGVAGAIGASISKNNPLMSYICAVFAIELTRLIVKKKTPVDLLLIPFLNCLFAFIIGWILVVPVNFLIDGLSEFINTATRYQPFLMGIVISVLMGMALTAPISSVAIATAIGLHGIAGGAAVVGCSVQMIGFAYMTLRDHNSLGQGISVGIGTSMLQFKNILQKPIIWLPTIITSTILGPFATCVFKMKSDIAGSGMGTCGLVGQIGTINAMGSTVNAWLGIIILHVVAPLLLVIFFDFVMRKMHLIEEGDLKI